MNQWQFTRLYRRKNRLSLSHYVRLCVLVSLFALSGCAVRLAPQYNQTIIDDLSSASESVFQLMAEAAGGTKQVSYEKRNDSYNNVIGQLEALELEIEARPIPKNKTIDKIIAKANTSLQNRGVTLLTAADTAPSATAVKHIIENITKMKETDQLQGLKTTEVAAFKSFVTLYLDQALTYESYLNN